MAIIPTGLYTPFVRSSPKGDGTTGIARRVPESPISSPVMINAFLMDRFPVTNRQFLAFVVARPSWSKSRAGAPFVDERYLEHWASDSSLGRGVNPASPVTNVSWFAAKAYCAWQEAALPTTAQWEYALDDAGREKMDVNLRALDWSGTPNPKRLPAVGHGRPNGYGVSDLIGLVWEWTLDFSESRLGPDSDALFCGAAGSAARDSKDSAAFLRLGFRQSLRANFATENLGFRCVKEVKEQ